MARPRSCSSGLRSRPSIGGVGDAQERVRGQQDEQEERRRDPGLHAQHVGLEPRRQVAAEHRHHGAEQRQDEDPQQHRAFMVSPGAGDLVDERHRRMRVLEHRQHGEIGLHVAGHQRRERQRDEAELPDGGGAGHAHEQRDRRGARRAPARSPGSAPGRAPARAQSDRAQESWRPAPLCCITVFFPAVPSRPSARILPSSGPSASRRPRPPWACSSRRAWRARCRP